MIAKRGITKDSLTNSYNEGKVRRRQYFSNFTPLKQRPEGSLRMHKPSI